MKLEVVSPMSRRRRRRSTGRRKGGGAWAVAPARPAAFPSLANSNEARFKFTTDDERGVLGATRCRRGWAGVQRRCGWRSRTEVAQSVVGRGHGRSWSCVRPALDQCCSCSEVCVGGKVCGVTRSDSLQSWEGCCLAAFEDARPHSRGWSLTTAAQPRNTEQG